MIDALPIVAFGALLMGAAYSDVATMTIPNWVSIALAACFPALALAFGVPLTTIGIHLLCGFAILVLGFLLFQANIFGGGDAKLFAAAAVWTGGAAIIPFVAWTTVAGGALALALLLARKYVQPNPLLPEFANRLLTPRGGMPYGVAIMTGGLMVLGSLPFSQLSLTLP